MSSSTHKMHEVKHAIRIYQACIDIAAIAALMDRPAVTHVISSNPYSLLQHKQEHQSSVAALIVSWHDACTYNCLDALPHAC